MSFVVCFVYVNTDDKHTKGAGGVYAKKKNRRSHVGEEKRVIQDQSKRIFERQRVTFLRTFHYVLL